MSNINIEVYASDIKVPCPYVHKKATTIGMRHCTGPDEWPCNAIMYHGEVELPSYLEYIMEKIHES